LIWLLAGSLFMLASLVPGRTAPRVFALLAGIALVGFGIRELRSQSVLLEVTERGIMIFASMGGAGLSNSLRRDLFVPWERVKSVGYPTENQMLAAGLSWPSTSGGFPNPCIVLKARMDPQWPPPGTLRDDFLTRNARPGEIYIRARGCSPSEADLWNRMKAIVTQYGVKVAADER